MMVSMCNNCANQHRCPQVVCICGATCWGSPVFFGEEAPEECGGHYVQPREEGDCAAYRPPALDRVRINTKLRTVQPGLPGLRKVELPSEGDPELLGIQYLRDRGYKIVGLNEGPYHTDVYVVRK